MLIALAILALIAIIAWSFSQATDKVIYQGPASLIANNFEHRSSTHRTLSVVPHQPLAGIDKASNILVATVTKAEADAIGNTIATGQITVRQRAFGQPRITAITR